MTLQHCARGFLFFRIVLNPKKCLNIQNLYKFVEDPERYKINFLGIPLSRSM
jgi:hypothetical protein